jgi:MOSC domain-containing protein YiiM
MGVSDRIYASRTGSAMLNSSSPLARLLAAPIRPGTVTWIGIRPARRAPLVPMTAAVLDPAEGLVGDHYRSRTNSARQVTLIQREDLAAVASYLGLADLEPERLRRNIVVSGINLLALRGCRFRLGTAVLLTMGECHPCSRTEELLGPGGYNAVRGHGGLTAQVVIGGEVRLGDAISCFDDEISPTSNDAEGCNGRRTIAHALWSHTIL